MSRAKDDEADEKWQDSSRHLNELQHLRQSVQMPLKYPSITVTRNDSDARRRPKPNDAAHKKSHSFFGTSPYLISSPQPVSESEAAESPFTPGKIPSTKRRARSSSSAGYSPTPSTSSGRAPSTDSPSMSLALDKNKSWLQEASGSEHPNMSPNVDRQPTKRSSTDTRRRQEDKENRDTSRPSAPVKVGSSTSTDILGTVSKGDIFKLTEMTTARADTSKQTSLARSTSHSRSLKQPLKPSEKTMMAARHLRTSIERRYATMAEILEEGKVYNPLGVIKHRSLRIEDGEPFASFHDDRYIPLLDPWSVTTDELLSDLQWQKAQLDRHLSVEQLQPEQDVNMDQENPNIPYTNIMSDITQGDSMLSLNEIGKGGPSMPPLVQRKGFNSVSPSLSPASTPPQSPNINIYSDPMDSIFNDEDKGKGFVDKRKSWSKPFFKRDKGKLKLKPDADAEVRKRYRNDEFLRYTQMTSPKERGLSPQLTNMSDSTLGDHPAFGQSLLVPVDRHVSGHRGHRRSVSTMDVLPVPTPQPLGTPEPFASADVSEADLSSEGVKRRPRLSSRRHSFDSLQASSKGSHRHFGIWSDRHHRKKSALYSDNEQTDDDYGRRQKQHFIRSANNSDSESDSNESDAKGHKNSKRGRGIRHFLKKETEFTNKPPRQVSRSSQEDEEHRKDALPESLSPHASLAARVALQEQKLREMVLYSDQEDSIDLQAASDMESTLLQANRSEQSEQGSPQTPEIVDDDKHVVKLSLSYSDLPPEVQNMIQQYEAMKRVEIVYSKKKKHDDEASSVDVADSIATADADTEAETTTTSEADTEEASNDKASEDKSADEKDNEGNSKAEKIAIVEASERDDIEFIKLLNVNLNMSNTDSMLVDLHVSMLGDADQDYESFEPILAEKMRHLESELERAKILSQEAKEFYLEHRQAIHELVLDESHEYGDRGQAGSLSSSSSSGLLFLDKAMQDKAKTITYIGGGTGSAYSSPSSSPPRSRESSVDHRGHDLQRAPSLLLNNVPYRSVSPFDYRQEEVRLGISALRSEMDTFQQTLYETENLIKGIQTDMNNTSDRVPTILHDIPEYDYSALKKLEVEVESILANRAKSPWLDMGYAWLSYVLAFTAFLVWVIIRILKWIRAVVIFPRTLWTTYSEYLVERDKAVKRASLQTVTSGFDKMSFGTDKGRRHHRHRHLRQRSSGADLAPRPSHTI